MHRNVILPMCAYTGTLASPVSTCLTSIVHWCMQHDFIMFCSALVFLALLCRFLVAPKVLSLQLRIPRAQRPVTAAAYPKGTRACHCSCVSQGHKGLSLQLRITSAQLISLFAHIAVSSYRCFLITRAGGGERGLEGFAHIAVCSYCCFLIMRAGGGERGPEVFAHIAVCSYRCFLIMRAGGVSSYCCLLISLFPHNEGRRGLLISLFAHNEGTPHCPQ